MERIRVRSDRLESHVVDAAEPASIVVYCLRVERQYPMTATMHWPKTVTNEWMDVAAGEWCSVVPTACWNQSWRGHHCRPGDRTKIYAK